MRGLRQAAFAAAAAPPLTGCAGSSGLADALLHGNAFAAGVCGPPAIWNRPWNTPNDLTLLGATPNESGD